MTIKKSLLEQSMLYRVAKVFFLTFPFLAIVVLYLKGYINVPAFTEKNIIQVLQANIYYILYIAGGVILYYILLNIIWRGILYIAFGGVEDDVKRKLSFAPQANVPANQPAQSQDSGLWILILIILIIYIATYTVTPQKSQLLNFFNKSGSQCVPTGCGTLWRCTGSFYLSGTQRNVNACFQAGSRPSELYSSWTGTCRQCP